MGSSQLFLNVKMYNNKHMKVHFYIHNIHHVASKFKYSVQFYIYK